MRSHQEDQRDNRILRRTAALALLYFVVICPSRWFHSIDGPHVSPIQVLLTDGLHISENVENFITCGYAATLVVLLVMPTTGNKWCSRTSLLTLSLWLTLWLLDVTRVDGCVLHALAVLMIGSSSHYYCTARGGNEAIIMAARIVTAGTWFWGGLHKLNPNFLQNFNLIGDPFLALGLGSHIVETHTVLLHGGCALMEAMTGLVLLVATFSSSFQRRKASKLLVGASIVFLVSMHTMIIVRLIQMKWDYSVLCCNAHFAFLAAFLWHPRKVGVSAFKRGLVVKLSIFVFLVLPAGLMFGIVDPYWGVSLYSDNNPDLVLELPAGGQDLYQTWGFLQDLEGWNTPFVPALTHDARAIYTPRMYILLNAAARGGHEGYPSMWSHKLYAKYICEHLDPIDQDDAKFFLQHAYAGTLLFKSLYSIARNEEPLVQPPLWIKEGCHEEWRRFHHARSGNLRHVEFVKKEMEGDPVDIYLVGTTDGQERPRLDFMGRLHDENDRVLVDAWVDTMFLAAKGGQEQTWPEFTKAPLNFCAVEVYMITRSESDTQSLVVQPNLERRTLPGVPPCQIPTKVEFSNGGLHDIDISYISESGDAIPVVSKLASNATSRIDSWDGHLFRAWSNACQEDYIVQASTTAVSLPLRHSFCALPPKECVVNETATDEICLDESPTR